jgi:hypothetical protein
MCGPQLGQLFNLQVGLYSRLGNENFSLSAARFSPTLSAEKHRIVSGGHQ